MTGKIIHGTVAKLVRKIMNNNKPVQSEIPVTPKVPGSSIFSIITEVIIKSLLGAAFKGVLLYFIWNYTISQELHLQEFSLIFCACAALFTEILLSSPGEASIIIQLSDLNKKITTLNNLTSLKMTLDAMAGPLPPKPWESESDSNT